MHDAFEAFLRDCLQHLKPFTLVKGSLLRGEYDGSFTFKLHFARAIDRILTFKEHRLWNFAQDFEFEINVAFMEEDLLLVGITTLYDDEEILDDLDESLEYLDRQERLSEASLFDPEQLNDEEEQWMLGCRRTFYLPPSVFYDEHESEMQINSIRRQLIRMCFEHIEDSMVVLKRAAMQPVVRLN